jgi:ribulose-5-phosphate 4-epimerase/fuculose-1-phosphate aldolase
VLFGFYFILMNRGVITVGTHPWEAAARLELVEHYARVLLLARILGRVRALPGGQVARLVEARFAVDGGRNL